MCVKPDYIAPMSLIRLLLDLPLYCYVQHKSEGCKVDEFLDNVSKHLE